MKNQLTRIHRSLLLFAASTLLLSGCSSTGNFSQSTGTGVSLNQKNYKVIKSSAAGKSSGFRLLGVIPFANPTYAQAKQRLYDSVGSPLTGRAVALANQTEDRSTIYVILFSIPKLTVTADVIEFMDSPTPAAVAIPAAVVTPAAATGSTP